MSNKTICNLVSIITSNVTSGYKYHIFDRFLVDYMGDKQQKLHEDIYGISLESSFKSQLLEFSSKNTSRGCHLRLKIEDTSRVFQCFQRLAFAYIFFTL